MRHIGRKGDNCKSNIGRQGVVVSVSKGLPNAAAAAHSGIEMVAKACNVHSSRGRVAGDRQTRAESPAGQIQLELIGECQDKVLEPVLLLPVPHALTDSAPKTFHSLDVLFPATARSICLPLAAKILCASSSKAFKSTCGSAAKAAFLPPPATPPVTVKIINLPRKPSRRTDVAGAVSKRLNLCAADCAQRRRSRDVWDS